MITKSQAKRKQDIKTKLMAAIAMLLVSSIMMVSSTYAWFTLSTAPEVTGIQTSVGANGNLEMALVPADGDLTKGITSGQGDAAKEWTLRNLTWGNLVDLSDPSYGLTQIQLYPSTLGAATKDANGNPETLGAALLQTPTYGPDGRVDTLAKNTVTSTYDPIVGSFTNDEVHGAAFGVRAVGNASGMTDRQLAYRNYRSAASTAMSQAKLAANASLTANGQGLANIAVKHATGAETHTQAEVAYLKNIVDDLLGPEDNSKIGALQYIEKAYINYFIAFLASNANTATLTDEAFNTFAGTYGNMTSIEDFITAVNDLNIDGVDVSAISGISQLRTTITNAENAKSAVNALVAKNTDVSWDEISGAMANLINVNELYMLGKFPAMQAMQHLDELFDAYTGDGVVLNVREGSGVYADIADHCGNYEANVKIEGITFQGVTLKNGVPAKMVTESKKAPYLDSYSEVVNGAGAPASGPDSQAMPISETYGYVIDLAFHTNAPGSNLLLQTAPKDRIYNGEGNEEVMGHGSTMTFESQNALFDTEQVKSLMSAIRIVFFKGSDVLATAKLDMDDSTPSAGGNGATAPIKLYEISAGTTTYTVATAADKAIGATTALYTKSGDNYTNINRDAITDYTDGEYYVATTTGAGETWIEEANAEIIALPQNTPETVSVLVYLEGEHITNADVAISGQSAVGTMNLQFSSDATLDPMDYTPLMEQSEAQATKYDVTVDGTLAATKATAGQAYTYTLEDGKTIDSITVAGTALGTGDYATAGNVVTISAAKVTGNIVITTKPTT